MLRLIIVLLLAASPALAGPGSWKASESGGDINTRPKSAPANGNANRMDVKTGPLTAEAEGEAHTNIAKSDQNGNANSMSTAWFTLKFCGDPRATGHRWTIESCVHGSGYGLADADFEASCWGDMLLAVELTGDHNNSGTGSIAVSDSGGTSFTLSLPPSFSMTLSPRQRTQDQDGYRVNVPCKTTGRGKACRVRVDTFAEAAVSASSTITAALALVSGYLRSDLEMTGYAILPGGVTVHDTCAVNPPDGGNPRENEVDEPTGGFETDPDGVPTDKPTDAERNGEEEDDGVDAESIEPGDDCDDGRIDDDGSADAESADPTTDEDAVK